MRANIFGCLSTIILLFSSPLYAQEGYNDRRKLFTVCEYNVENLFDCEHDSLKEDHDFTPEGSYHWTRSRYWKKVNAVAKAIMLTGTNGDNNKEYYPTDLVALCEVENDSVMHALTKRSLLRGARYEYIMTHSEDVRGIDVALMYNVFSFKPLAHYPIRIDMCKEEHPTRDILYVKGRRNNGSELHIFVVHAPSRRGGENTTRNNRIKVAERLTASIDSIRATEPNAHIMALGDFNDYGNAPALKIISQHDMTDISKNVKGSHGAHATYRYQGEWNSLDHVFISESMRSQVVDCKVFDHKLLLERDTKYGGVMPRRYIKQMKANGGYSDHLPLITTLRE